MEPHRQRIFSKTYLDIATSAVAFERSVCVSIQLDFWLPIDWVERNDADFGHEFFELFEGDVVRQTADVNVAVLILLDFKPR